MSELCFYSFPLSHLGAVWKHRCVKAGKVRRGSNLPPLVASSPGEKYSELRENQDLCLMCISVCKACSEICLDGNAFSGLLLKGTGLRRAKMEGGGVSIYCPFWEFSLTRVQESTQGWRAAAGLCCTLRLVTALQALLLSFVQQLVWGYGFCRGEGHLNYFSRAVVVCPLAAS